MNNYNLFKITFTALAIYSVVLAYDTFETWVSNNMSVVRVEVSVSERQQQLKGI